VGVHEIADLNSGSPQGLAEMVENRRNGLRQVASAVYPLKGVQVMTDTLIKRVLIEERQGKDMATGVELASGTNLTARREVILSAGAYRTPQILLLLGIGPIAELKHHGIVQTVDAPEVGKNFHDHMSVTQWWKLRNPEAGVASGSPLWKDAAFRKGNPLDFIITQTVPYEGLKSALATDEGGMVSDEHPLLSPRRSHMEAFVLYAGANKSEPLIPMDGIHVSTSVVILLPTWRGSITLASTDPATSPLIDPNYYATEADRYVMRTSLKKVM
jgi:choline dehydrogenase-like flavoprotein